MKKWNTPAVAELSIEETANGLFPALYEGFFGDNILNNDCGRGDDDDDSSTPENVAS